MAFEFVRTVPTTASPAAVWALWSDPGTWPVWDPAVQSVALEGHFAEGAAGIMTLAGPMEAPFVLEIVEPGTRYLDRLTIGELVIRIDHVVVATESGADITVRTTIDGPGADDIGPIVTNDTPVAMAKLVEMAEG
jgi:hypothetical protein